MSTSEKYISEAPVKEVAKRKLGLVIKDRSVATRKLADGSVTASKIADLSVTTAKIADNAITTSKIANGNVTTTKIKDGAVTSIKIAERGIATSNLADGSITTAKLGSGSITTDKIGFKAVTSVKLADKAVVSDKIADNAVLKGHIKDGSIVTSKIADSNVTTDKLADGAVTHDKIKGNDVSWGNLDNKVQDAIRVGYGLVTLDSEKSDVYSEIKDGKLILKVNTIPGDELVSMLSDNGYNAVSDNNIANAKVMGIYPEVYIPQNTKATSSSSNGTSVSCNYNKKNCCGGVFGTFLMNSDDSDIEMNYSGDELSFNVRRIAVDEIEDMMKAYNYAV